MMAVARRLYRGETTFDFVGRRNLGFILSGVFIVVSLVSLVVRGLNLGVDFEGGTVIEISNETGSSVGDVRDELRSFGLENATIQLTSGTTEGIRVQTEIIEDQETETAVVAALAELAGVEASDANVTAVGPAFGEEITRSAVRALVIFLVVITLFISWRFEWKMAAGALAALFHDLILTAGVYSVTGFEVTPATVIAILTILGYSLYDTVVVYDKIIETVEVTEGRHGLDNIINGSMNTVLMRSLNTSLTSLLPIGSLLLIGSILLGATTLREFALALFVGVAAGTYSSIVVASPILYVLKRREPVWSDFTEAAPADKVEEKPAPTAKPKPTAKPRPPATGPKPRPPKKGRKRR
jgi:preprotein translocase subunit SecF